ncbi:MAG: type II toxin-antitoxin system death-on-curing family toxin [Xanthomonadaceae bacterium]|nr:type II toxin-antitoxin system death-on-curing family toxin [Xanthomonadaceae bacterium]
MTEPVWISSRLALAIHERQIAEHGGDSGLRDSNMLESALARPRHQFAYGGPEMDIPAMAAAYAFGLAKNHPFVDGNKRTAYVVCRLFLRLNGWDFINPLADRYTIFLELASGAVSEAALVDWLRTCSRAT